MELCGFVFVGCSGLSNFKGLSHQNSNLNTCVSLDCRIGADFLAGSYPLAAWDEVIW